MSFTNTNQKSAYIILAAMIILLFLDHNTDLNEYDMRESDVLLVDNLSDLNKDFIKEIEEICLKKGRNLIIKKNADVNDFKNIEGSYSLIILRVHSTNEYNITWLFTKEEYSRNTYYLEQVNGEIYGGQVEYNSNAYFVINGEYIKHYLTGNIEADCLILMGCNGLDNNDMAQAWLDAGVSSFVGWKGDCSLNATDNYTLKLVQRYFQHGLQKGIINTLTFEEYREGKSILLAYKGNK